MLQTQTVTRGLFELLTRLMRDKEFQSFSLAGGTALSLLIGHRKSIDIDLFTPVPFNQNRLLEHLSGNYDFKLNLIDRGTVKGVINGVQLDCLLFEYPHVEPVIEDAGIRLYSKSDIAAIKLSAIAQNGERVKDFIDIAYLSMYLSLNDMLNAYEKKFPYSNKIVALKGLTYYNDIDFSVSIAMINEDYNWGKIENRLQDMIKKPEKIFLENNSQL